jgi:hypothetical protein
MPFQCPECTTSRSLAITTSIELPSDSRSDEITLQIVRCSRCRFEGITVYEESRRGRLDSESFDHYGLHVDLPDVKAVKKAIKQCPNPRSARCKCEAHRILGQKDSSGRWNGLGEMETHGRYRLLL